VRYAIRFAETIADDWPAWFGPAQITFERDGSSRITIDLPDAAALNGLLAHAAALQLTLKAVWLVPPAEPPSALPGA
jgi:hypothetical protein